MLIKTLILFFITAIMEIVGCYSAYLFLRKESSILFLVVSVVSLAIFAWLLTIHPAASGRVYAAYGGVYVCTSLIWLRLVDGVVLSWTDWLGAAIALLGMAIIVIGWDAKPFNF